MEISDTMIINLYENYLVGNNVREYIDFYKEYNISIWIDFLDLFIKYQNFPSKSIIKEIIGTGINESRFFVQLLNEFIDYFNLLKIKKEDLPKESIFSFIKFMLKYIITNEDDKIENYIVITSNIENIDKFFVNDLDLLFQDLKNCCLDCVNNNKINPKFNLEYIFKVFDFLTNIRANKYNELYISIKEFFFDVKSNKITLKLDRNLDGFLEQEKIKKEITFILSDKNFDSAKSQYLLFIEKYANLNKEYNNKLNILYLNMLNEKKLISTVQNNINEEIKKYDINNILKINIVNNDQSKNEIIVNQNLNNNIKDNIKDNMDNNIKNIIQNNKSDNINNNMNENKNININNIINDNIDEQIYDEINQNKLGPQNKTKNLEIDILKENLIITTNRDYFKMQIKKYSKLIPKDSVFYTFQKKKNSTFKQDIFHTINKKYFRLVYAIFQNLLKIINLDKKYEKIFGYIVINKNDYIYTYYNENVIANSMYNVRNFKKYSYKDFEKSNNLSELLSESNKENESNENEIKENESQSKESESKESKESKENKSQSKESESKENENQFVATIGKGFDFESNSNYLFNSLFNLKVLPNYFFHLQKKGIKISNLGQKTTFSEYNKYLFTNFLESDGVYINDTNDKIIAKSINYKPFDLCKTFICSKNNNIFELTTIEEELVIGPKTIIITESKISMPKDKEDPNNLLNKVYRRSDLDKTLLFTLNKLIRKIDFYYTFVKNEFLTEKDDINEYKFLLCLFYNNIPVSNIDKIIEKEIKVLIENNYIQNEFKLKCLNLIPNIASYNIRNVHDEINEMNVSIKEIKEAIDQIKKSQDKEKNKMM